MEDVDEDGSGWEWQSLSRTRSLSLSAIRAASQAHSRVRLVLAFDEDLPNSIKSRAIEGWGLDGKRGEEGRWSYREG